MSEPSGAAVVIVGGGATGLSAAWWLARAGVDVLVIDKGIVAWEASGRNGGGCTHGFSPLFAEEQRLWPQMDELLGYPTEFCSGRIRIAMDAQQFADTDRMVANGARLGFTSERLDAQQLRELVPLAGECYGATHHHFGGHANPHRTVQGYAWAMQDHGGRLLQHTTVLGFATEGRPGHRGRDRPRHVRLRPARAVRRAADGEAGGDARRACADGGGTGRDDRDRAAAADAAGRGRRQRALWAANDARQPRLWRRAA